MLEADADSQRLRLGKFELKREGLCLDLTKDKSGRYFVNAKLPDLKGSSNETAFLVNTARTQYANIMLGKQVFQSYVDAGLLTVEGDVLAENLGGLKFERFGRLTRFEFGKNYDNVEVREGTLSQVDGIGLSCLLQFNFAIDFPNAKLYLTPRKENMVRLLRLKDLSGLGLFRQDFGVSVVKVEPRSPAARAEIREGDILVSINNLDCQKERVPLLRTELSRDGKKATVKVRRPGKKSTGESAKEFTVELELKDWRVPVSKEDFE